MDISSILTSPSTPLWVAIVVALISIVAKYNIEKKKATFSFLNEISNSEFYEQGADVLRLINDKGTKTNGEEIGAAFQSGNLQDEKQEELIKHARLLFAYLNILEVLSLGIYQGIYKDAICKKAIYSRMCHAWQSAETFINKSRRKQSGLYENLEKKAKQWMKEGPPQ